MHNLWTRTATAISVAMVMCVAYGNIGVTGQVSQESMRKLRYEHVRFDVPGEITIEQGQPMFIGLCRPVALPGVPVSLTNPARSNSMMGAGVCGMTNMPGSTINPVGGNPPYHFETEFSFQPFGLHLNNTTGFISGTPTQRGRRSFTVCAYDASGNQSRDCQRITIKVVSKKDQEKKKNAKDQDRNAANQNVPDGEPIDATPPPDKWGHPMSGATKALLGGSAGAAAGLTGWYLGDKLAPSTDLSGFGSGSGSGSGSGGSSGTSGSITITGVSTLVCRTAGAARLCTGTMTIRNDSSSLVGTTLTALTNPSNIVYHGNVPSVGGTASWSTPSPNGSSMMTACTNQTSVSFVRPDNTIVVTRSQSIPMSCQ